MAPTNCPECQGELTAGAAKCSHCGHPIGAWGKCPECQGPIAELQESCKECGFPLRPTKRAIPAPVPPPPPASPRKGTTGIRKRKRPKGRPLLQPGEESPAAMMFAFAGLLIPIFAFIALAQSKRGTPARRLAWIGIAIWITCMIFIFSRTRAS